MPGRGRGRGRGGGRGRGRGRGRGGARGRSRSRGGSRPASHRNPDMENGETVPDKKETLDITKDVRSFFRGSASFDDHFNAQTQNKERYAAGLATLLKNGVQISQNARVRGLAAAWARHDPELANALLLLKKQFGLVEVLKALTLLDSNRRMSRYEKRLKQLTLSDAKVGQQKLAKLRMDIKNLQNTRPKHGSASGAVCKHIRRWVQTFSQEELEYYALHFPKGPWKKLADICHLNPKKDFPKLPWFLPFCFGQPAPEGTMVSRCGTVTEDNINGLVAEFPLPFSHIKDLKTHLTTESKARIAGYTDTLDQVIWNYEDLQCPESDGVIQARLSGGEDVSLPNGKLLERLLTLKMIRENIPARFSHFRRGKKSKGHKTDPTKVPFLNDLIHIAEKRVKNISLQLDSPVVIMGDASGSMEVSIRTSTIIAGLLSTITAARLVFFNTETRESPFLPKTVEQVLELAVSTQASGGTTPAASLYPFYRDKEVVKTIIVVTDEEENGQYENESFDTLFKKYHTEVYPARLVFVSFLRNQHSQGEMVSKLADYKPLQFKLDSSRPDLTKLDTLFGLLSADSQTFEEQLGQFENRIRPDNLQRIFQELDTGKA